MKRSGSKRMSASANDRRLSVQVTRASLSDATGRPLREGGCFSIVGGFRKRVFVEAWEDGRSDRIFYAPFLDDTSIEPNHTNPTHEQSATTTFVSSTRSANFTQNADSPQSSTPPVQFVNVLPDRVPPHTLVDVEDDFEISFVGMVVPPFDDTSGRNANELLLYSVRSREPVYDRDSNEVRDSVPAQGVPQDEPHQPDTRTNRQKGLDDMMVKRASASRATAPTSVADDDEGAVAMTTMLQDSTQVGLNPHDVPTIHFDPDVDGSQSGSVPNVFVTMPASKSLLFQGGCCEKVMREWREDYVRMKKFGTIGIRFTVLEIDRITNAQAAAIANATELGSVASSAGVVVPYANIISWAFSFASSVGEKQLKRYARPDYVIGTDFAFKLVRKQNDGTVTDVQGRSIRYAAAYLRVRFDALYHSICGASFFRCIYSYC